MSQVLAVDLGGTKTSIALIDEAGRISEKRKVPAATAFDETIEQIAARCSGGIVAAGVIVPGIYDSSNGSAWAPNLWGRDFHPLHRVLEQRLAVPIAIGSDRTGSVLAEQWLGVARGLQHVVFVAVGTGIGVGVLAGGWPFGRPTWDRGSGGLMVTWRPLEARVCRTGRMGNRGGRSRGGASRGHGIGRSRSCGGAPRRPTGPTNPSLGLPIT